MKPYAHTNRSKHCDCIGCQATNCPESTEIVRFKQRCLYSQTDPHTSDGRYLVSCEDWECSSMYKCNASYCIPVHYICDRVCDCPSCDDEHGCITNKDNVIMPCPGMVKCKKGYPCVHKHHLHDGEPQCVDTRDDEFMSPPCPAQCSCHGTSIYCPSFMNVTVQEFSVISATDNDYNSLERLQQQFIRCPAKCPSLYYLDISSISNWNLDFIYSLKGKVEHIRVLNISHNEISVITHEIFGPIKSLIYLYMAQCGISAIESGVFIASSVQVLDLSYNKLTIIDDRTFGLMYQLVHMSLRNNQIYIVQLSVFHSASKMKSLDLRNNKILSKVIDPNIWASNSALEFFYSDEQVLCCIIPTTKLCQPVEDMYQTCSYLLQNAQNKYILGTLSTMIIALNVGVLIYLIFWKSHHRLAKKKQIWTSAVSSLSDVLLGVYIAGDIIYGSSFGKYREQWKISNACMLLESAFTYFVVFSCLFKLHVCTLLLCSSHTISIQISHKQYKYSVIGLGLVCTIVSFVRRLLILHISTIEANVFCIPLILRHSAKTSDAAFGLEWGMLAIQSVLVSGVVMAISAVIYLQHESQKSLNQSSKPFRQNTIVKLAILICLKVLSKTPMLVVWFCVMYVQIKPDILLMVILSTLSVWPICHPFCHTIRLLK